MCIPKLWSTPSYSRFRIFSARSCYRSLNAFCKAYLCCHLKRVGGTPKSAETPNIKTLGRADKWTCSVPLGSSRLLSCQLTGCGSPLFWSRGEHRQINVRPCLPLHLQLANFCYYAITPCCDICLNFHLGRSFSDGMYCKYSTNL